MAAYIVADIEITDPAAYEEYKPKASAALQKYGAKILARGGAVEPKEGGWAPKRLVVIEFPDMATLRRFYDSPEYTAAREIRQRASRSKLVFVEGV
jgi:uncharacterized protein (DUF1330 family)